MSKEVLLVFTDECGAYVKDQSDAFKKSHPFYVRSNLIINVDDYLTIEEKFNSCKESAGVDRRQEIKWSHYGNAIKKRINNNLGLSSSELELFYCESIKILTEAKSASLFFTFSDNRQISRIDEIKMIKMHLQNAFQRVHKEADSKSAVAFVIADDMNDKNKSLKKAMFDLTQTGDVFTKYENVNKGLFVDYSDQCCGLQLADICAGVFTANLKYLVSSNGEKNKYMYAHKLFEQYLCSVIRADVTRGEWDVVYGYGIRNVPNNNACELAKKLSSHVEEIRHDVLMNDIASVLIELQNEQ